MDYFDTDEIRRRRILEMQGGNIEDGGDPMEEMASQALAPEEEDYATDPDTPVGPVSGTPKPAKSGMGPAQQRYAQVLQQAPQRSKTGIGRRILAGIAGAGGGPEAAYSVLDRPYLKAMGGWQSQVQAAGMGAGLEEKVMAQDIAQQRANAYGRSAAARETAASATQAWRQYQQAHMAWQPTDEASYMRAEAAKHPVQPKGWQPQSLEEYLKAHPPHQNQPALTMDDRLKLIDAQGRTRAKYRAPAKDPRPMAPANPNQQGQAEDLAVQQLLRSNPEYEAFTSPIKDAKGATVGTRIKGAHELPKAGGGFLGIGGTSPAHESLAREQYRKFLMEVDKRKKTILGTKSPDDGGTWSLEVQE